MLLLVGLGNPGSQYAGHRHNVGFMAVDAIHRKHGFAPWRRKFQAEVSDGVFAGEKCLLIKPQTYMNESGRSVGEAMRFFKLEPNDVLVIHDEVDLAPGKLRMKAGGGAAGHNGLRSIGAAIGQDFRRLRIGVGKPDVKELVPIHVLHDFSKEDRSWLDPMLDAIGTHAPLLAEGKDSTFSNRIHEAIAGGGRASEKPGKAGSGKAEPRREKPEQGKPDSRPDDGEAQSPFASLKKLFGR